MLKMKLRTDWQLVLDWFGYMDIGKCYLLNSFLILEKISGEKNLKSDARTHERTWNRVRLFYTIV